MTCSKFGCKAFAFMGTTLVGGYHTSLCEVHTDAWVTFVKQTKAYVDLHFIEREGTIIEMRLISGRSEVDEHALRELFEKRENCLQELYETGRNWVKEAA